MTPNWRAETVESLRGLILGAVDGIVEDRKWREAANPEGVPVFSYCGEICTVDTYSAKVEVIFARGASLPDPSALFNAHLDDGARRAIDITGPGSIDPGAFVALVRSAVDANRG